MPQFVPVMEQIGEGEGRDGILKYQVASPKRAAEGGRRSKGGMPWSGRREDEAAR